MIHAGSQRRSVPLRLSEQALVILSRDLHAYIIITVYYKPQLSTSQDGGEWICGTAPALIIIVLMGEGLCTFLVSLLNKRSRCAL
jgi:hypothetical protein